MHASSVADGRTSKGFQIGNTVQVLEAQCQNYYFSRLIHLLLVPGFVFRCMDSYYSLILSLLFFFCPRNTKVHNLRV